MKLSDTDLTLRDREWVERELGPGEELLLVCKPALTLWKPGYTYRMFFATLWNAICFGIIGWLIVSHFDSAKFLANPLPFCCFFVGCFPFFLIGIGFIVSPWWERETDRRTVYVLTSQRALVLRPSTFRRQPHCRQFPLSADMIKEVKEHCNGRGDIILGYDEHHGKNGVSLMPVGFLYVENVRGWESRIRRHLPAAPPPATIAEDTTDSSQLPALGYVPLAIVALLFSVIYLVRCFCLAEAEPLTKGNDISAVLFVACIAFISSRTVWRWVRGYRKHSDNGTMQKPTKE